MIELFQTALAFQRFFKKHLSELVALKKPLRYLKN